MAAQKSNEDLLGITMAVFCDKSFFSQFIPFQSYNDQIFEAKS